MNPRQARFGAALRSGIYEVVAIRKLARRLPYMLLFSVIWVILNEKIGWEQIVTGLVLSLAALAITDSQLLLSDYTWVYRINPLRLLRYAAVLLGQIYASGFSAIVRIVRGRDDTDIVRYETALDDDLAVALLANAVTLTPGTVTVDIGEEDGRQHLEILTFTPMASQAAIRRLERILSRETTVKGEPEC
ncbi:MAG: Na+/H+ antiporter subunit E [Clostridiaceae bacterium]|jgi:multicomponent Na+:H+ antiporter subunit E|nr:Na+/H+ antiporter subunit E [Eubacteriales bacterium]MDD4140929.1 Na+/H+ antiporter subunit E [Eubacteriales bacterium]NLB44705.1 Na+/H+ antiporter subunit E [Clostridiaceae bacterium]